MFGRQHLAKRRGLGGLIFICNDLTERECFRHKIFGLPIGKINLVEQVHPRTPLFLFNFDRRELLGIYEAVSHGGLNLEPRAFKDFQGSYPAQVRFSVYRDCLPLPEAIFKDAIIENYYAGNKFNIELTAEQVSKLEKLFRPKDLSRKSIEPARGGMIRQEHVARIRQEERVPHIRDKWYHERLRRPLLPHEALVERDVALLAAPEALGNRGVAPLLPRKRPLADSDLLSAGQLERVPRVDAPVPLVPQAVTLGGSAGLLEQGHLDEIDQLALKYLKRTNPDATSSALRALDVDNRRHLALRSGDSLNIGHAPLLSRDPWHDGPLGAVRHLRDDGRLLPFTTRARASSSSPLGRRLVTGPSREPRRLVAPRQRHVV